jgi:hypothetical protein
VIACAKYTHLPLEAGQSSNVFQSLKDKQLPGSVAAIYEECMPLTAFGQGFLYLPIAEFFRRHCLELMVNVPKQRASPSVVSAGGLAEVRLDGVPVDDTGDVAVPCLPFQGARAGELGR